MPTGCDGCVHRLAVGVDSWMRTAYDTHRLARDREFPWAQLSALQSTPHHRKTQRRKTWAKSSSSSAAIASLKQYTLSRRPEFPTCWPPDQRVAMNSPQRPIPMPRRSIEFSASSPAPACSTRVLLKSSSSHDYAPPPPP